MFTTPWPTLYQYFLTASCYQAFIQWMTAWMHLGCSPFWVIVNTSIHHLFVGVIPFQLLTITGNGDHPNDFNESFVTVYGWWFLFKANLQGMVPFIFISSCDLYGIFRVVLESQQPDVPQLQALRFNPNNKTTTPTRNHQLPLKFQIVSQESGDFPNKILLFLGWGVSTPNPTRKIGKCLTGFLGMYISYTPENQKTNKCPSKKGFLINRKYIWNQPLKFWYW